MVTTNIHIKRCPVVSQRWVPGLHSIVWISVAQEIPATAGIAIHRVGFALSWAATSRAGCRHPLFLGSKDRLAITTRLEVLHRWQNHWQICRWHWYGTMLGTMDDRDRCTPVALAANQPVTHLVGYFGVATTFLFEPSHNLLTSILAAHTIKCARINEHAFAMVALVSIWVVVGPLNDGDDGQLVFLGKGGIALIMSRHSHHCTGAIATKDIIGHPDGYSLARCWIHGITSGKDPCLILRVISALNLRFLDCLGNIGQDRLVGITTRELLR